MRNKIKPFVLIIVLIAWVCFMMLPSNSFKRTGPYADSKFGSVDKVKTAYITDSGKISNFYRPKHRSGETIQPRLKYYGQVVDYNGNGIIEKNEFKVDSIKIIMTSGSCGNQIKSETPLIPAPPGFAFNPKTGEYDQTK